MDGYAIYCNVNNEKIKLQRAGEDAFSLVNLKLRGRVLSDIQMEIRKNCCPMRVESSGRIKGLEI